MKRLSTRAAFVLLLFPLVIFLGAYFASRSGNVEPAAIGPVQIELAPIVRPHEPPRPDTPRRMVFSPDSKCLLVATMNPVAEIYDVRTGTRICQLPPPVGWQPTWSPDGEKIVAAIDITPNYGRRGEFEPEPPRTVKIRVWDASTGSGRASWFYGKGYKYREAGNLSFTSDGKELFCEGFPWMVLDARDGRPLRRFIPPQKDTKGVRLHFNPARDLLAWEYDKPRRLEVIDPRKRAPVWQTPLTEIAALTLAWGPKNVLGFIQHEPEKQTIHLMLWDGHTRESLPPVPIDGAFKFALNPEADTVAIAHGEIDETRDPPFFNTKVTLYDYRAGRSVLSIPVGEMPDSLMWSPDGRHLLVQESPIGASQSFSVYNLSGDAVLTSGKHQVHSAVWSPDSKHIAAAIQGGVRLLTLSQ